MSRMSAFVSDKSDESYKGEFRYDMVFGAALALCGFLLLAVPVVSRSEVVPFLASWMLFIAVIMSLLRPALFRRGLPDAVMALLSAALYGFLGYAAGGANIFSIEGYRLVLCILLLFMGFARLTVFARMLAVAAMPMQLVCAAADIVSGALLFWSSPDGMISVIYWYAGMLLLIDGAASAAEAVELSRHVHEQAARK